MLFVYRTDMVEPVLSRLNSAVGSVLRAAFGQELDGWLVSGTATACQGGVADAATCESVPWNYMLQYPRVPAGEHGPPSHQVVVRGHMSHTTPSLSVADLHIDCMDGGGTVGTCTVFAPGSSLSHDQWTDFVVFPGREGGHGVRVRVMEPGWVCALVMPAADQLHGGVLCSSLTVGEQARHHVAPPVEALHVVTYNLRQTEEYIKVMHMKTAEEQWAHVRQLDLRLQNRL